MGVFLFNARSVGVIDILDLHCLVWFKSLIIVAASRATAADVSGSDI